MDELKPGEGAVDWAVRRTGSCGRIYRQSLEADVTVPLFSLAVVVVVSLLRALAEVGSQLWWELKALPWLRTWDEETGVDE